MASPAGAPGRAGSGWLSQSRSLTAVTVIAPVPSPATDSRSTANSVPPVVTPHGSPRMAWSTVYDPPPLSVTSVSEAVKPASQDAAWMLWAGVPGVHSDSPSGRVPLVTAQVNGAVPALGVNVWL